MGRERTILDEDGYRRALARVQRLSDVPLGMGDPRAAELDEWLAAVGAYEGRRAAEAVAGSNEANGNARA